MREAPRRGFSLVEVALAMALVAVAVLSLFLVIPEGFKAQRAVRYQVLAAAKAMELVDMLHTNMPGVMHNARDLDMEGVYPWDGRAPYASMSPDLETALESMLSVVKPLPEGIGRRFDSDGDEIAELLDRGGRLYYFYPSDPSGSMMVDPDLAAERSWFDATDSLIVGVVGSAQQNSILHYPALKLGPYQAFYPTPPTHGRKSGLADLIVYDTTRDPRIETVWHAAETYRWGHTTSDPTRFEQRYGAFPYLTVLDDPERLRNVAIDDAGGDLIDRRARAAGYLIPCLWYAEEVGLLPLGDDNLKHPDAVGADGEHRIAAVGTDVDVDGNTVEGVDAFAELHSGPDDWAKVLAMRYLAHAGMCFASCYRGDHAELDSATGVPIGGGTGDASFPIAMTMRFPRGPNNAFDWAPVTVNLDRIRAWHEASVRMAVRHADRAGPYHWGAPRPLNRQVMMDHPLVQLDLWSPPVTDRFPFAVASDDRRQWPAGYAHAGPFDYPPYVIGNVETRRQWRAVYGSDGIAQPGAPFMYPGRVLDTSGDGILDEGDSPIPDSRIGGWQPAVGKSSHFNLTHPFDSAERSRQLVFWSVDWQSYEDFESHPSAELDGSRYPIVNPFPGAIDDPMAWNHPENRRSMHYRQLKVYKKGSVMPLSTRNPEHLAIFELPTRRWDPAAQAFLGAFYNEERPTISEINDFGGRNESKWQGPAAGPQQSVDITSHDPAAVDSTRMTELLQHPKAHEVWNKFMNLGIYGANRNGQLSRRRVDLQSVYGSDMVGEAGSDRVPAKDMAHIDRGSVPASVRMRATTVARFVFYDPRISGGHFQ